MTLRVHPNEIVAESRSPLVAKHVSWERVRLGDVCELTNGFAFKSNLFNSDEVGVPLIRIRDVGANETSTWYSGEFSDEYLVLPGDLLIGMDGDFRASRWQGISGLLNQRVCRLRIRNEAHFDGRFLEYVLPGYLDAVHAMTSAVTVKHLSSETIKDLPLPLPPLAEQQRIVEAIEEHFSRIDAGVIAVVEAGRKIKRMQDAIGFAAARGLLVPQDPDEEPAEDQIARVTPSGRFRGLGPLPDDLGELPPGWSWASMARLAKRVTVGHVGPMKDEYVPDGVPFLRSQNVRPNRFDPQGLLYISSGFHKHLQKSQLRPGDLVIVRSGNVGTACVIPDYLEEANCADLVIVQGPEAIDPHYAAFYMNSLARTRVRAGRVGVALTHFNTQSVAELPVPVPPLAEQHRIVAEAERLMSMVNEMERVITASETRANNLRSSVLTAAFCGHLVPQDPRDEPARLLLERIHEDDLVAPKKQEWVS